MAIRSSYQLELSLPSVCRGAGHRQACCVLGGGSADDPNGFVATLAACSCFVSPAGPLSVIWAPSSLCHVPCTTLVFFFSDALSVKPVVHTHPARSFLTHAGNHNGLNKPGGTLGLLLGGRITKEDTGSATL